MVVLYVLLFFCRSCFFGSVCALVVNPKKVNDNNSRFYRALINGSSRIAVRLLRIKIHTSGIEKLPKNEKIHSAVNLYKFSPFILFAENVFFT